MHTQYQCCGTALPAGKLTDHLKKVVWIVRPDPARLRGQPSTALLYPMSSCPDGHSFSLNDDPWDDPGT